MLEPVQIQAYKMVVESPQIPSFLLLSKSCLLNILLILGIALLVCHLLNKKNNYFLICTFLTIIVSFAFSIINIVINGIWLVNSSFNKLSIIVDNGNTFYHEFHPIVKIVFYSICLILTGISYVLLRKLKVDIDNKKIKSHLFSILFIMICLFKCLTEIQAWII